MIYDDRPPMDVYKNLNGNNVSIRSRETHDYGTVREHAEVVMLEDVEFVVGESGSKDVKETGIKNVHAFARGDLVATDQDARIRWNLNANMFKNSVIHADYYPKENDVFEVTEVVREYEESIDVGDPIEEATTVVVTMDGCRCLLPADE